MGNFVNLSNAYVGETRAFLHKLDGDREGFKEYQKDMFNYTGADRITLWVFPERKVFPIESSMIDIHN